MRLMMSALSSVLSVYGKSVSRWEQAVADDIAVRAPTTADDRAAIIDAIETGAFNGMRKEARRVIRTGDRKQATTVGISVGAAFIAGALAMWIAIVMLHWGPYSPSAESAAAWHDLVERNPDPRPAIAGAQIRADPQTGRRYYAGLSLWLDPARPPGQ